LNLLRSNVLETSFKPIQISVLNLYGTDEPYTLSSGSFKEQLNASIDRLSHSNTRLDLDCRILYCPETTPRNVTAMGGLDKRGCAMKPLQLVSVIDAPTTALQNNGGLLVFQEPHPNWTHPNKADDQIGSARFHETAIKIPSCQENPKQALNSYRRRMSQSSTFSFKVAAGNGLKEHHWFISPIVFTHGKISPNPCLYFQGRDNTRHEIDMYRVASPRFLYLPYRDFPAQC
jgi:hypothetical protein